MLLLHERNVLLFSFLFLLPGRVYYDKILTAKAVYGTFFAESMNFYLEPGKTYRIHSEFFGKQAPEGWQNFWLAIHVRGCVLLDQLSIVEIP